MNFDPDQKNVVKVEVQRSGVLFTSGGYELVLSFQGTGGYILPVLYKNMRLAKMAAKEIEDALEQAARKYEDMRERQVEELLRALAKKKHAAELRSQE